MALNQAEASTLADANKAVKFASDISLDVENERHDTTETEKAKEAATPESNVTLDSSNMVPVENARVFDTFSTTKILQDGLCLLRCLGDGKYEIVNLDNIPRTTLSSEEAGRELASVPERGNLFHVRESRWEDAMEKCSQVAEKYSCKINRSSPSPSCGVYADFS
jgi:hypothetical protein